MSNKQYRIGITVSGEATGAVKAMDDVTNATSKATSSSKKHAESVDILVSSQNNLSEAVSNYGGLLIGSLGAGAMSAYIQANYEAIAVQQDYAKQLGISYSRLEAYGHAARAAGLDSGEFAETLRDLAIRIDEYINIGTGEAADIFEQLKLNVQEFKGLRPDEQFFKIAEALEQVNDEGEKRVYLDQLGSDSLVKLLPLIKNNAQEFKRLSVEAVAYSTALNDYDAQAIKDADLALKNLGAAANDAGNYLTANFAPGINSAADAVSGFFRDAESLGVAVDGLSLAGATMASVYAGKVVSGITASTAAHIKKTAASHAQVKADLAAAQTAKQLAVAELSSAAAIARAKLSTDKKAEAARRAKIAADNYKAATERLTVAQAKYNAVASAGAKVTGALKGGMRLLGGPAGLVLTVASAFTIFSDNADEANSSASDLSVNIDNLSTSLDELSKNQARQALVQLKESMSELETQAAILAGKAGGQLDVMNAGIPTSSDDYKNASAKRTKLLAELDTVQAKLNKKLEQQAELERIINNAHKEKEKGAKGANTAVDDLAKAQEELLASLFPLEAKQAEYNEKQKMLIDILDHTTASEGRRSEAIEALKKQYIELFPELEKKLKVEKDLEKQSEKDKEARKSRIKSNKDLIDSMQEELDLLGLSERERFIETQMRKLSAEATDEQREALRRLAGEIYDQQNVVDEYAKAWEDAGERIDQTFADMWKGGIDSFDDFADQLKDSLKSLLGELAHMAITKPILVSLGITGQGSGGSVGSAIQSLFSGGGTGAPFSLDPSSIISGIGGFFNSSSVGEGLASGLGQVLDFAGVQTNSGIGSFLADASNNLGLTNNLAMGLGGIGGSLLSDTLGLSGKYSGVTGSVGTAVGAALLTPILGPLAPFAGSFLGSALGGLFGNKKPSNKEGNASVSWDTDAITVGGQTGKKFSQENRDAASALASNINGMIGALELLSGNQSQTNYTVGVGDRDGKYINYQGPNDSSVKTLINSDNPEDLLNAAAKHFAAELQVDTAIFTQLQKSGEVITDTIQRVVSETYALHGTLEQLGLVEAFSADTAKFTQALIEQAGGAEALAAGANTFYSAFYTEEEKFEQAAKSVAEQFESMSLAVPETREAFRELVESLSASGEAQAGQLLAMAPAMDQYYTQLKSIEAASGEAAEGVEELAGNLHKLAADSASQTLDLLGAIDTFNQNGDLGQAIAAEQQRLASLQQSENSLYQEQQKRYQAAIQGEQTIQQYLDSLNLGSLSTLTYGEREDEAKRQFEAAIASGNASEATSAANSYLTIARENYASGAQYQEIFGNVKSQLSGFGVTLGNFSPPGGSGGGSSSTSATLEKLLAEQAKTNELQQELQQLINATTVAEKIGDLGLAQDTSVFDLSERFGLNMNELAATLGVQVDEIDGSMVGAISAMSELLHVTNQELLEGLGADLTSIPEGLRDQLLNADQNAAEQQDLINSEIDVMRSVLDEVERGNNESVSAIDRVTEAVNSMGDQIAESVNDQIAQASESSRSADEASKKNASAIDQLARRMDDLAAALQPRVA